jgi:protein involved in polysaccharide export with SLBB domain
MRGFRNKMFHYFVLAAVIATAASAFDTVPQRTDHAPSSYVLGPDDMISIHVLQAPEVAEKPIRIDLNGYIARFRFE